jgi:hypothetical protein
MGISKLKFESVCRPKNNGCGKLNIDRKILGMVSSFYQPFCDWGLLFLALPQESMLFIENFKPWGAKNSH